MASTYLSSRRIIDSLLANSQFVNLAKTLVNSDKGSTIYKATYDALNVLLTSLGITPPMRMNIITSDGGYWYSNFRKADDPVLNQNLNVHPEVFSALNYAFGNPIRNKKIYPIELQSSVCSGYGFAERRNSFRFVHSVYTAKTYKPSSSPLSTDVFTIRVIQDV
jgi:hypothetical protein